MRDAAEIFSSIRDENGNITETIKIITHSMGAAFGKGFVTALTEYMKGNDISMDAISFEADFAPFQPLFQKAVDGVKTYQFSKFIDPIAGILPISGAEYNISFGSHSITSFDDRINKLPK